MSEAPRDKPVMPGYYNLKEYWPPESIERRRTLRGG
jgi:hypothetical protein